MLNKILPVRLYEKIPNSIKNTFKNPLVISFLPLVIFIIVVRLVQNTWSIGDYSANSLTEFRNAIFNVVISTILLSFLVGILIQAIYVLGLRSQLQSKWVIEWAEHRSNEFYESFIYMEYDYTAWIFNRFEYILKDKHTVSFSLPYIQICGQISSMIRSEMNSGPRGTVTEFFAFSNKESFRNPNIREYVREQMPERYDREPLQKKYQEELLSLAEVSLDALQIYLANQWSKFNVLLSSIIISQLLIAFIFVVNRPTIFSVNIILYAVIAVSGVYLSSLIQQFIETKFTSV